MMIIKSEIVSCSAFDHNQSCEHAVKRMNKREWVAWRREMKIKLNDCTSSIVWTFEITRRDIILFFAHRTSTLPYYATWRSFLFHIYELNAVSSYHTQVRDGIFHATTRIVKNLSNTVDNTERKKNNISRLWWIILWFQFIDLDANEL